jgi:hypothetical protein
MNRQYDIFQKVPDGSVLWIDSISVLENALGMLKELACSGEYSRVGTKQFLVGNYTGLFSPTAC